MESLNRNERIGKPQETVASLDRNGNKFYENKRNYPQLVNGSPQRRRNNPWTTKNCSKIEKDLGITPRMDCKRFGLRIRLRKGRDWM